MYHFLTLSLPTCLMSLFALPSWRQIGIFTDDDMSESDSYTGYQSSLSTVTTPQLATWNTFEYMNNKDVWCTRRMGTWVVALCHLSLVTTNIWSSSLYHLHCNIFIVSFLKNSAFFIIIVSYLPLVILLYRSPNTLLNRALLTLWCEMMRSSELQIAISGCCNTQMVAIIHTSDASTGQGRLGEHRATQPTDYRGERFRDLMGTRIKVFQVYYQRICLEPREPSLANICSY